MLCEEVLVVSVLPIVQPMRGIWQSGQSPQKPTTMDPIIRAGVSPTPECDAEVNGMSGNAHGRLAVGIKT